MYNVPNPYTYPIHFPYYHNVPMNDYQSQPVYWPTSNGMEQGNQYGYREDINWENRVALKDYGRQPMVININEASKENKTFRTALWTGNHLQVTLMSIRPGEDIGLEVHPTVDQFLRVEEGKGLVQMGYTKDNLSFQAKVFDDYAIMVPAGTWHNVINTGKRPLKLYSIYAPPNHPFGTVHQTKADAMAAERYWYY